MCGITGYSGEGNEAILTRMNETLAHRGPDDSGLKVFRTCGLAQRRLSIIDISPNGHQPMCNEDRTIWIAFNGEIYNFKELRQSLIRNHTFRGSSDTEVILHLYEEMGTAIFSKLQGMFAIALYDSNRGTLILARDRMGKKPLYWTVLEKSSSSPVQTLIFGSELKSLMVHPRFRRDIDLDSVHAYFLYENVPTPHTIFKRVHKLEPGTFLIWDGKNIEKQIFWRPSYIPKSVVFNQSLRELDKKLEASVRDRLVADVPVGIFLSGGLDSSIVSYYASRLHGKGVKTFSIGFSETSYDESPNARKVAAHLGTEHHERIISASDCLALIPHIADMIDEPMADASIIPTYLLSKFAREHVTVALGGDGADELFCGYDTFLAHRLSRPYSLIPNAVRTALSGAIMHMPTSYAKMSLDFKLKRFIGRFSTDPIVRDREWFAPFDRTERKSLFDPNIRDTIDAGREYEQVNYYRSCVDSSDAYDNLELLYQRLYLMDEVLVKVDRASMMNSLEVRSPFLDTRVVELANHLPLSAKFRGLTRKYILRKLMEGRLPREIIYGPKKGFSIPIGQWLTNELRPLMLELLSTESMNQIGFFDSNFVNDLIKQHLSGNRDNRKQLWSLMVFVLWWRRWIGK